MIEYGTQILFINDRYVDTSIKVSETYRKHTSGEKSIYQRITKNTEM